MKPWPPLITRIGFRPLPIRANGTRPRNVPVSIVCMIRQPNGWIATPTVYPVAMILLFEHMKGGMLEKHDRLAVPNAPIPDHLQRLIYRWFEALDILAFIRVSTAVGDLVRG